MSTRPQRRALLQTTSRDALRDGDFRSVDARILAFVRANGGATVDEIEVELGLPHQTASAQVSHMRSPSRRLLHATKDKRLTRRGRNAVVWAIGAGPSLAPFPIANPITDQLEMPGVRS